MPASVSMASGEVELRRLPSASSATDRLIRLASVSARMRLKSSFSSARNSTRIGRRPCNSGNRSEGFETWEGTGRDEQDMIRFHRPVFGRHGRTLDQRQQVALNAFTGKAGAHSVIAGGDLVDLVKEHDTAILGRLQRQAHDLVLVQQLVGLAIDQTVASFP